MEPTTLIIWVDDWGNGWVNRWDWCDPAQVDDAVKSIEEQGHVVSQVIANAPDQGWAPGEDDCLWC